MRSVSIVGNPENRRVTLFSEDARRLGWQVQVVPWEQLLSTPEQSWPILIASPVIRIESPGENRTVEQQLIARGASSQSAGDSVRFSGEYGRIEQTEFWYAGFCDVLQKLKRMNDVDLHGRWMNLPDDIMVMFDKRQCQSLLRSRGVSVPEVLGFVESWESLVRLMDDSDAHRVFVKLPHSSSASGVIALQRNGQRWVARTSVEIVRAEDGPRLYNSLSVQRYDDRETIAAIVNELGRSGLHVERWVPKAGFAGRTFDLRVVVIAGEVRHTVMRTSVTPMTNLHLGNARGDLEALRQQIPEASWNDAMESCRHAAGCFPDSLYLGIDLLFTPGFRSHVIVEANAFGDLLPGILSNGQTTYEAELLAMETPQPSDQP
ncbi:MAG: STM4014 family protein [Planctomycetaceae bacterium]